ncbi:MAG: DUF485 domain-containing protein [Leucobacter sp.]
MSEASAGTAPDIDYEAFQARPEFQAYKRRQRGFIFPLTAVFMIWFFAYVLLAAYAHEFMAAPLLGMNVGLWLGLLQFVSTFAITMSYVRFANKKLDPETAKLRAELEDLEIQGVERRAAERRSTDGNSTDGTGRNEEGTR